MGPFGAMYIAWPLGVQDGIRDMATRLLVQQHNVTPGREGEAFRWFQQELVPSLFAAGVTEARRYALHDLQLQPDGVQSYRYLSLFAYDRDAAPAAREALSRHARQRPLASGMLSDDAGHVYDLTREWVPGPAPANLQAPEYLVVVMANYIETMETEYNEWYDRVHGPEVLAIPEFHAMQRGRRAPVQTEPANPYPSNALVLLHLRTEDVLCTLDEFRARATGESKTGIHWNVRSPAASLNRTTHVFAPTTPLFTA